MKKSHKAIKGENRIMKRNRSSGRRKRIAIAIIMAATVMLTPAQIAFGLESDARTTPLLSVSAEPAVPVGGNEPAEPAVPVGGNEPAETPVPAGGNEPAEPAVPVGGNELVAPLDAPSQEGVMSPQRQSQEKSKPHDFTENIISATVQRKNGSGVWEKVDSLEDGDDIKVEIKYSIPANTVTAENRTISYQIPSQLVLNEDLSGVVMDNGTPVGTYTISKEGLAVITFNENFADASSFIGYLTFEGTVQTDESGGEDGSIDFGGGSEIIPINPPGTDPEPPDGSEMDIAVNKTGTLDSDTREISYTVTVHPDPADKGTEGNPITITDQLQEGDTPAEYKKDNDGNIAVDVVKIDASGNRTSVETTASKDKESGFKLENLPPLGPNESYEVTYKVEAGDSDSDTGAGSVKNKATAQAGDKSEDAWYSVATSQPMVQKSGSWDKENGTVTWTIQINPDHRSLDGYTLTDTIKQTVNGVESEVSIPTDAVITLKDNVTGKEKEISLPLTFSEGDTSSYIVTYTTPVPEVGMGESWKLDNRANLTKGDKSYTGTSAIEGRKEDFSLTKNNDDRENVVVNNGISTYVWESEIQIPDLQGEEIDLNSILFVDDLGKVKDRNNNEKEGLHYTTPEQLNRMELKISGKSEPLTPGVDYQILNKSGGDITGSDDVTHLDGFQIRFLDNVKTHDLSGKTITIKYASFVDNTSLENGTYKIPNAAHLSGKSPVSAEVPYTKQDALSKQASATGRVPKEDGSSSSESYKSQGVQVDYEHKVIHYQILLKDLPAEWTEDITLTDKLPQGTKFVPDSIVLAYYNNQHYEEPFYWDGGEKKSTAGFISATENTDGTVSFTIRKECNEHRSDKTLAVYYDVSFEVDPSWTFDQAVERHSYKNQVTWGDNVSSTTVTVVREDTGLEKTGENLPHYDANGDPLLDGNGNPILSDTVRYAILINRDGRDLVPDNDTLTLKDTLTFENANKVDLLLDSVRLYYADEKGDPGAEVPKDLYSFSYTAATHEIQFRVPDETAFVLQYDYFVERGDSGSEIKLQNKVLLEGGAATGSDFELTLKNSSSSAGATKRKLTLYKMDASNNVKMLPEAEFSLEYYDGTSKTWKPPVTEGVTLITDSGGSFTLDYTSNSDSSLKFKDSCLYRLKETKAPAGYAAPEGVYYYFVWVPNGQTAEQVRSEMEKNDALPAESEMNSPAPILFLAGSGTFYVSNEPTALTVKKVWQDSSFQPAEPGAEEVTVQLMRQTMVSNKQTVTVISTGQNDENPKEMTVDVADGSGLAITMENVYADVAVSINGGEETKYPAKHDADMTYTFHLENIKTDTTVRIRALDREYPIVTNVTFAGYALPGFVADSEAPCGDPVQLNRSNGWQHTWNGLPQEAEDGTKYYYCVKETSEIPGYIVSYSVNNNSGIQTGELIVANRETGYTLPDTGGPGTRLPRVGGAALLLASACWGAYLRKRNSRKTEYHKQEATK